MTEGKRTSLTSGSGVLRILTSDLARCHVRHGRASRNRHESGMERMLSSNNKVKSKPPRQVLPAHGPKELSTESGHDLPDCDMAGGLDARQTRCGGKMVEAHYGNSRVKDGKMRGREGKRNDGMDCEVTRQARTQS